MIFSKDKAWRRLLPTFIPLFLLVTGCSEEEAPQPSSSVTNNVTNEVNNYVNSWIHKNMEYWYLWNKGLPESADKNQDPKTFFENLLHSEDRFSWIQENYQELLNSLQGISKEAGYEFVLYREKEAGDNVIMQILYIKPGSPAFKAGLKPPVRSAKQGSR